MQRLLSVSLAAALAWTTTSHAAGKSCEELQNEIAAKLDAKGVVNYQLKTVTNEDANAQEADGWKVVGSCEAGTQKIVYKRGN